MGRAPTAIAAIAGARIVGDNAPRDLPKHLFRIAFFVAIAILAYHPFGGKWINHPSPGWDANFTGASWDATQFEWSVVDCIYFAMVTMTVRSRPPQHTKISPPGLACPAQRAQPRPSQLPQHLR
jgi:hypothetical protein